MIPGNCHHLAVPPQRQELAHGQPGPGIAYADQEIELLAELSDLAEYPFMVVLKRHEMKLVLRELAEYTGSLVISVTNGRVSGLFCDKTYSAANI